MTPAGGVDGHPRGRAGFLQVSEDCIYDGGDGSPHRLIGRNLEASRAFRLLGSGYGSGGPEPSFAAHGRGPERRGNRMENGDGVKRLAHRVLAALLALGAVACQQDREDAGVERFRAELRDSAGIRIVENQRPPDGSRLGWRIGPEPAPSIGVLEGEEPYMLHEASDAAKLPDGRIVVANAGSQELRVFDAKGTHLVTWGGRGEGPGEFVSLSQVAPWPGDSIVAWFSHGNGISVFDSAGAFGRSFSLPLTGDDRDLWVRPVAIRGDGKIFAILASPAGDSATLQIRHRDGTPSASLGTHPYTELALVQADIGRPFRGRGPVIFARALATGLWGDLVVAGFSSRYEFSAFRADGALARIVRSDHPPRVPTEADRESLIQRQIAPLEEGGPDPRLSGIRQLMESTPLAEAFPAFSSVLGDATGHLWVREYDFPREPRPAPLWTVFDPGGRVLGFVETPADLEVYEIGEDYLLGRTRDDFGVESIQLWPLERKGG